MSAYAIFIRERTRNAGELQTYAEMVAPLLGVTDATVLAAYGPQDVLEGASPEGVVNRIVELFRSNDFSFSRMIKLASAEPPRVRALLGTIGTIMGENAETLKPLKESLNATTTYKLGLAEKIPAARSWGIR